MPQVDHLWNELAPFAVPFLGRCRGLAQLVGIADHNCPELDLDDRGTSHMELIERLTVLRRAARMSLCLGKVASADSTLFLPREPTHEL
jgi:hypothetical protein